VFGKTTSSLTAARDETEMQSLLDSANFSSVPTERSNATSKFAWCCVVDDDAECYFSK